MFFIEDSTFLTEGNEEKEELNLFRIFACAASTNTAGGASTPAFAQLRRGRQRGGYNIYETASNQSRHACEP
jgi:hypothetical protein